MIWSWNASIGPTRTAGVSGPCHTIGNATGGRIGQGANP